MKTQGKTHNGLQGDDMDDKVLSTKINNRFKKKEAERVSLMRLNIKSEKNVWTFTLMNTAERQRESGDVE